MSNTKRITISVNTDVDVIREHIKQERGIDMTYVQLFNYLIHYYKTNSTIPKTVWKKN